MFGTSTFQTKNYQIYFDPRSGELSFVRKGAKTVHLCGKVDQIEDCALFLNDPQDPLSYLQLITG